MKEISRMKWLESTGGPMDTEWPVGDRGASVMVAEVEAGTAACRLIKVVPIESAP